MKTIFRSIMAILTAAAVLASCNKEVEVVKTMTTDVNAVTDVAASNPAEISVALTTNVNWIVQTPEWITPSAVFGSGDAILTFKVGENYVNETTTVAPRTGEIKISGGGSIDGVGVSASVTVSQLGYTYVDPNAPIEQIPDAAEFIDFIKAINSGNTPTRWMNDNGEVTLSNDIDLSEFTEWQQFVTAANNGNNSSKVEGKAFSGVFDGNGYKITGFNPTVHLAANQTFGLFSLLNEGVVKNVVLEGNMNVTAEGQADAGMLVGTAYNSTVKNVTVNGKITSAGTTVGKRFSIGGVCGYAYAGTIGETEYGNTLFEDCVVNAEVDFVGGSNTTNGASCAMYGGICGFATTPNAANPHKVTIRNCVNNGNMNVKLGRCSGIIATANTGVILEDVTNNGNQVNTIANGRLGNIVCNVSHYCTLKNCVNNGDLDATAPGYSGTAGGIFALAGSATITGIEGGGNYGTIKTLSTAGKYIGLLWANHNAAIPTKNMVASGRIIVDGVEREINASNYMENLGSIKVPESVTDITWVAPKN